MTPFEGDNINIKLSSFEKKGIKKFIRENCNNIGEFNILIKDFLKR